MSSVTSTRASCPRDPALLAAAQPRIDRSVGVLACCYDARDPARFRVLSVVGIGVPMPMWMSGFRLAASRLSERDVQRSFCARTFGTISDMLGERFLDRNVFARALRLFGMRDAMGINAMDPTGIGCVIGAGLPARQAPPPGLADLMSYVCAHIAAGHRLRRQIERAKRQLRGRRTAGGDEAASTEYLLESAEAIMNPGGEVTHACDATKGLAERLMLRAAATAFDRARLKRRRRDPEAALLEWKALVGGRWTVVDCFDRDGRRFLVANRNDPRPATAPDPLAGLTLRERQVVGYAALGHANKVIAYELGLAPSSVATHLSQAAAKLGVGSRAELIGKTCWTKELRAQAASAAPPPREAVEEDPPGTEERFGAMLRCK